MRFATLAIVGVLTFGLTGEAFADPPSWAPAHGWRKHKGSKGSKSRRERYYVGYSGREYRDDFGTSSGRCNREKVGAVIGGVIGGVVGNEVSDRDDRVVATILGAAVGALIGARIGRDMDERDRACFGHALELGPTGRRVYWTNESNGLRYELVPGDGNRGATRVCREFTLTTISGRDRLRRQGSACQASPGVWNLAAR
jgi:surface antigen